MNRSREFAVQLFNDLDRRLKSADKKDQLGVIGQGRDSVNETEDKDKRKETI